MSNSSSRWRKRLAEEIEQRVLAPHASHHTEPDEVRRLLDDVLAEHALRTCVILRLDMYVGEGSFSVRTQTSVKCIIHGVIDSAIQAEVDRLNGQAGEGTSYHWQWVRTLELPEQSDLDLSD